jgi:hypothetical protein
LRFTSPPSNAKDFAITSIEKKNEHTWILLVHTVFNNRVRSGRLKQMNRRLFWLCGFEEEACWLPVGYAFRRWFGIWSWWYLQFFCWFYTTINADDGRVSSDPGPDLVQDDPPFGALQFTADEVQSVLLQLDVRKSAGPDGIPLLKNCASAFARSLSLLFNRSLSKYVFPDRWKL